MALVDMFLKLESARAGQVKGEANDAEHGGEIDVVDWSWGMGTSGAMGGKGDALKSALQELRIVKRVDAASTALMSVMRTNDLVKKAVLTVRKAGNKPMDYFIVTVEKGRITQYEVSSNSAMGLELTESLSIAFEKIDVEYRMQDEKGGRKGGSNFTAEVRSGA
jgi:type VI secretion system secreted protein Hcp